MRNWLHIFGVVMEQFGVLTMGSRLKRLSDYLFAEVQTIYQRCHIPISSTYFPILRLLQENDDLSVVEIADRLGISHPAVSKQVVKMLKEHLLEKAADGQDQRRSVLRLSPQGKAAMAQVAPILQEMKVVLDQMTAITSTNFMAALNELDRRALDGFASKVLDRIEEYQIVPMAAHHEQAFYHLNMAWLKQYFPNHITPHDELMLSQPREVVVDKGGQIWCAVRSTEQGDSVLGTIALQSNGELSEEIFKLTVVEHCRGKGIAQQLLTKVINEAHAKGTQKLTLETASCLTAAGHLYAKNGFIAVQPTKPSKFERTDVYMEKNLGGQA